MTTQVLMLRFLANECLPQRFRPAKPHLKPLNVSWGEPLLEGVGFAGQWRRDHVPGACRKSVPWVGDGRGLEASPGPSCPVSTMAAFSECTLSTLPPPCSPSNLMYLLTICETKPRPLMLSGAKGLRMTWLPRACRESTPSGGCPLPERHSCAAAGGAWGGSDHRGTESRLPDRSCLSSCTGTILHVLYDYAVSV